MTISFTIIGNQENRKGNPIPYHRSTQGAKWNTAHRRYLAWKDHVREAFLKNAKKAGWTVSVSPAATLRALKRGRDLIHPFAEDIRGRISCQISFGAEGHADPDNVAKGILDALFANDQHVDVETHHSCRNPEPKVEVTLTIEP